MANFTLPASLDSARPKASPASTSNGGKKTSRRSNRHNFFFADTMDHVAQLQAWRDYVDGSSSDYSDQAAPWPPRRADPGSPANPPRLDRSPASLSDSGDLETWLESIGVPSAGPPPAHEGLYAQIEQRGYSRDEIDSLQEQFERFAGFRFDRAPALISALEARRKVFAQAEDELRRRQTQEAKKRKAAARVVVEKRNINPGHGAAAGRQALGVVNQMLAAAHHRNRHWALALAVELEEDRAEFFDGFLQAWY